MNDIIPTNIQVPAHLADKIGKPSAAILKAGVAKINSIKNVSYDTIIAAGVAEVLGTKFAYAN